MTDRRTALFWRCDRPPAQIFAEIQANVAERGRHAHIDDGRLVLSGPEHYTVFIDSGADAGTVVRLEEDDGWYARQCENRNDATNLLRIVLDVAIGALAQYCVFPVPTDFVPSPDWDKADRAAEGGATFVLLPTDRATSPPPVGFRAGRLTNGFTMLMSLPMKRYPGEEPPTLSEVRRATAISRIETLKRVAEEHYDKMYDVRSRGDLLFYRDAALESLADALKAATDVGLDDEANAIRERQHHIRAVGRQLGS